MMELRQLQQEVAVWSDANFGSDPAHRLYPLLGMIEESGELCETFATEDSISPIGPLQTAIENIVLGQALWGRMAHRVLKAAQGIRGERLEGIEEVARELDAVCAQMEECLHQCGLSYLTDADDDCRTPDQIRAARVDAVGDIEVFLADFCRRNGLDLDGSVFVTWARVSQRNWVADPEKGGVE